MENGTLNVHFGTRCHMRDVPRATFVTAMAHFASLSPEGLTPEARLNHCIITYQAATRSCALGPANLNQAKFVYHTTITGMLGMNSSTRKRKQVTDTDERQKEEQETGASKKSKKESSVASTSHPSHCSAFSARNSL